MKISTSLKALAIACGMLMTFGSAVAKVTKPTSGGGVVIGKIFSNMMKNDANKAYAPACYIQLYNNSTDTLDIAGMYIGMVENHSTAAQAWTVAAMAEEGKADSVAIKQLFRFPTDKEYRMDPGQSIVVTNAAWNHSSVAAAAPDLTNADFEVKTTNNAYKDYHNDAVPAMELVHSMTAAMDFINFSTTGPGSIVLLAHNLDLTKCGVGFQRGKTSGNSIMFVPNYKIIDAIDVVVNTKAKSPSADDKRISTNYDAGFTAHATAGGNNGEAIVRKTAYVTTAGRTVLFDTDNSSLDCEVVTDLAIRSYSQTPAGLSDSTITIPATGYLPFVATRPFCAGKDVSFVYLNVSNNAATTDMTYYTYPGDSLLLIKGPWIAIGAPGEHALKLSESQGVMKTRSSGMSWADEDSKSVSQTTRMFYKFVNEAGNIGFKRVDAVDGKYNQATFSGDDRLYYVITEAIADKIAAANGATDHTDLNFIAWHGITPADVSTGISNVQSAAHSGNMLIFNLQGQRQTRLQRGLNIVNGKKVVIK